jgi:uncharacterized protein
MKKLLASCLILGLGAVLRAADPAPIEFTGLLVLGAETRFSLVAKDGTPSPWVQVGGEFQGWKLLRYDPKDAVLVLGKDGVESPLSLKSADIKTATAVKATIEDANRVLEKMRFDDMMTKILGQQKKSMAKMMQQMTTRMGIPTTDAEAVAAFQTKVAEVMMGELKVEELQADFAQIYSDAFTKQQLDDLGAFYTTSTGQALVDKQPEIQVRFQELITPRMMRAMPKVQAMAQQFQAELAAKKAAAAPVPAAAPAPPKN